MVPMVPNEYPTPAAQSPSAAGSSAVSASAAVAPAAAAQQGQGGEEQVGRHPLLRVEAGWLLIWKKDTWGNYGQHSNLYTFFIDLERLEQVPLFKVLPEVRHEKNDSRKNIHRKTWARLEDLGRLNGVLKVVRDYASSAKREVDVAYFSLPSLSPLEFESGLRDSQGFFDRVHLPDRILLVRKDRVEVVER
ncbi:MAG: hypothetical protein QXJ59_04395 [Thermofilaceae archaeon]